MLNKCLHTALYMHIQRGRLMTTTTKRMLLAWYIENSVVSVNASFTNSAVYIEKDVKHTCNKDVSKNDSCLLP